jgi:hypothetical protein
MLKELTISLEQDFSFPFFLSISVSVVFSWMASPGEETGAGHEVGGVKVTSIMVETDLERRVLRLHIIYTL